MYKIVNGLLLFPYSLSLKFRNLLYDKNIIKSVSYDIPVISVGNITVGGTGKTPHVEFLIRLLESKYRIAVISRGYKRKSKGFREVSIEDNYRDTGDEPLQIKRKFPHITVAVDGSRCRAIEKLMGRPEDQRPQLILLDDAFQHRKVRPQLSILLIDYNRPITKDYLLPLGRLRDLPSSKNRADIVIVTKTPETIDSIEMRDWRTRLKLKDNQHLFFSMIDYDEIRPVFDEGDMRYAYSNKAVLFSGIANDKPLKDFLARIKKSIVAEKKYGDHHNYSKHNIRQLDKLARRNPTAALITTEKDSQRLFRHTVITPELKKRVFYIPICPQIIIDTSGFLEITKEEIDQYGKRAILEVIEEMIH